MPSWARIWCCFRSSRFSGYPPEDLLFHRGFRRQIESGLARVRDEVRDVAVLVGFPEYTRAGIYNSAALIADGEIAAIHRKAELPNYKVFDEKRYFHGRRPADGRRLRGLPRGAPGVRGHRGSRRPRSWRARPARSCLR